jgi:hypothetical protein
MQPLLCFAPEDLQTKEFWMSVAAEAPTVEVAADARMQPDAS